MAEPSSTIFIASLTAAIVSSGFLVCYYILTRQRERKALLMAYFTELVGLFERTVLYYCQRREGGISYSALYEASDSNMLARFAGVVDDPEIINAIIRLKSIYYQIQRHALEASKLASEIPIQQFKYEKALKEFGDNDSETIKLKDELNYINLKASHAQSRAIAFIAFDEIVAYTQRIIDYAKKKVRSPEINKLEVSFYKKTIDKYKTDLEEKKHIKETES